MQKVTVVYIYEGKSIDSENGKGVVITDNKVFVSDQDGIGLYEFQATNDPNTVIVNLDVNPTDYLNGKAEDILDLICA
ncbi:MAG: hypothetical protein ABGX20_05565 [Bacillus sp. (in: firmicutes)]